VTERILATGEPVLNHEFSGQTARAPGIVRQWNESWYPLRDDRGEVIGFGAVVEEITVRKRAEATKQNFQALAVSSAEIPYRLSADWTWLDTYMPSSPVWEACSGLNCR